MSAATDFDMGLFLRPGETFHQTPPAFHIEGMLPDRGVCLVTGAPNVGKSTFMLWLLYQLRGYVFERIDGAPGYDGITALYVALEGQDQVSEAWHSFEQSTPQTEVIEGIHRHRNHVVIAGPPNFDITDPEHIQALKRAAARGDEGLRARFADCLDDCIIVIDSLSASLRGQDENAAATMSAAAAGLQDLAAGGWEDDDGEWNQPEGKALVVCLHHPTKGGTEPRGSGALIAGVDCALHITQQGDVLTVKNTRARGFAKGATRRYTRRIESWCDLAKADSPDFSRVEFDEIPDAPAPAKAGAAPPAPAKAAPAPKAPPHPATRLRGRATACWGALGPPPGGAISLDEAKALCTSHPCFADVPPGRVANRWADVVGAWQTAGLVDDKGMVRNPTT